MYWLFFVTNRILWNFWGFILTLFLIKAHDHFSCNCQRIKLTLCYYKNGSRRKRIMDKYFKLVFQVSFCVCLYICLFVSAAIKTRSNNSWSESTEGESKFSRNLIWWWVSLSFISTYEFYKEKAECRRQQFVWCFRLCVLCVMLDRHF